MKRRLFAAVTALGAVLVGLGATPALADTSEPSWLHLYATGTPSSAPDLVAAPDGHVWFIDNWNQTVDRIEFDGTITNHPFPGYLYSSRLVAGPDGGLWLTDYSDRKLTGQILSRLGAAGGFLQVRALAGVEDVVDGGADLWILNGQDTATRITSGGSIIDFSYSSDHWLTVAAAGADGSLWLKATSSPSPSSLTRIGPDGAVTTVSSPLPAGDLLRSVVVTADGSAWFSCDNGQVAVARPDGSSSVPFDAYPSNWSNQSVELVPATGSSDVWVVRIADEYGNATQVSLAKEDGTRTIDLTLPAGLLGSRTVWADSSNHLWLTTVTYGANYGGHLTEISSAGAVTEIDAGPEGQDFTSYSEASDGAIWATRGNANGALTTMSVDKIDPRAGTVATYPTPVGVMPQNLVLDAQDIPWVGYARYVKLPEYYWTDSAFWGSRPPTSVERVAGADRYATSVAVSQAAFPNGAPVVYVASGENYPDGLSASAAAGHLGGPVLLTSAGSVTGVVLDEIKRLKPGKIVIAGGVNAVSAAAAGQLRSIQPNITRVEGGDRYATSRALAVDAFGAGGSSSAYLATGQAFPDALAAAGAAGAAHAPVILVDGNASDLDAATEQLLRGLDVTSIHIVGGLNAVSAGIELAASRIAATDRLAGADRYATAAATAESITDTSSWARVFVASGQNYPDAIPAGAWAAGTGHPLVLAPFDGLTPQVSGELDARGAAAVEVAGGPAVLSWAVLGLQVEGTTLQTPW